MTKKRLVAMILTLATALCLCSCGEKPTSSSNSSNGIYSGRTLYVEARLSGYGEWLNQFAEDFEDETGCVVDINWNSKANDEVRNIFSSDSYVLSDLYFVTATDLWYKWAKSGLLYEIDGFDDVLQDEYVEHGLYDGKRYTLNVLASPIGLVYNQDYLDEIPSKGEYTQGTFPETFQGLLDMCDSINEAAIQNGSTTVKPMCWGGKTAELTQYFFRVLWAQGNGGKDFSDYMKQVGDAPIEELFTGSSLTNALEAMSKLINSDGSYSKNSLNGCGEMSNLDSEQAFLRGDVVFCSSGGWFETEMKNYITNDTFEYGFANMPLYDTTETERTVMINIPSESFLIPKKAEEPELAVAFLKYVFSAENAASIHNVLGTPLTLDYDFSEADYANLSSDFARQVTKVVEDCVPVTKGANSVMYYTGGCGGNVLDASGNTLGDELFTVKMMKNQTGYTYDDIPSIIANNYQGYQITWNAKLKAAGLK